MATYTKTLPNQLTSLCDLRQDFAIAARDMRFYLNSFIGGRAYSRGNYLWKMLHGEDSKDERKYGERKARSKYNNLCKSVVNGVVNQLLSTDTIRRGVENEIGMLRFKDWDNRRVDIDQWFRYMITMVLVVGEVFIIFDSPVNAMEDGVDNVISNYDRINSGIEYSVSLLLPQYVPSVTFDEYGEINQILIETNKEYVLWNNSTLQRFERSNTNADTVIPLEPLINQYSIVPAKRFVIDVNQDGYGDSILSDIAGVNQTIYNVDSIRINDLLFNAQNVMLLPVNEQSSRVMEDLGYVDSEKRLNIKGKDVLPIAEQSKPEYLIKNLDYHNHIAALRKELVEDIQYMANEKLQLMVEQSGVSKAYDSINRNDSLEGLSYLVESFEYSFWEMFFKVAGINKTRESIEITYKHKFDVIDKNTKLTNLITTRDLYIGNETITKSIDRIILTDQLSASVSDNEMDEILESLTNHVEVYEEHTKIDDEPVDNIDDKGLDDLNRIEYLQKAS